MRCLFALRLFGGVLSPSPSTSLSFALFLSLSLSHAHTNAHTPFAVPGQLGGYTTSCATEINPTILSTAHKHRERARERERGRHRERRRDRARARAGANSEQVDKILVQSQWIRFKWIRLWYRASGYDSGIQSKWIRFWYVYLDCIREALGGR